MPRSQANYVSQRRRSIGTRVQKGSRTSTRKKAKESRLKRKLLSPIRESKSPKPIHAMLSNIISANVNDSTKGKGKKYFSQALKMATEQIRRRHNNPYLRVNFQENTPKEYSKRQLDFPIMKHFELDKIPLLHYNHSIQVVYMKKRTQTIIKHIMTNYMEKARSVCAYLKYMKKLWNTLISFYVAPYRMYRTVLIHFKWSYHLIKMIGIHFYSVYHLV